MSKIVDSEWLSPFENRNAACECTVRGPNLASRTKSFAIPVTSVYLKEHKTRHQQRPARARSSSVRCHIQMAHPQRSSARGQGNHH